MRHAKMFLYSGELPKFFNAKFLKCQIFFNCQIFLLQLQLITSDINNELKKQARHCMCPLRSYCKHKLPENLFLYSATIMKTLPALYNFVKIYFEKKRSLILFIQLLFCELKFSIFSQLEVYFHKNVVFLSKFLVSKLQA